MPSLKEIWIELASKYSNDAELISQLWNEIESCYSSQARYYHNLLHLEYMFDKIYSCKLLISDLNAISFSIFYHDIVYNAQQPDNEEKSAELAMKRLEKLGVPENIAESCCLQILATKAHAQNTDVDTAILLDADLAILGDTPEVYMQYTSNIRKEYSIYTDEVYNKGRLKVLQHFLEMDRIFKTSFFFDSLELPSRENLKQEQSVLLTKL
jgi:predicted metal-dependent HD superfamily phosphohydrolase